MTNESLSDTVTHWSTTDLSNVSGIEVLAHALDEVRVHVLSRGVDRAFGVGTDDEHVGVLLLEVARSAGDRPARPDGDDERVDLAPGLLPDLRTGGLVVRPGVELVRVLVGLVRTRDLLGEPVGHRVVALRRLWRDRVRADDDLGSVRPQQRDLLLAHLVGHDEDAAVALQRGGDREAGAGVAGGGLDDRAARFQLSLPLGSLDHRDPDPVLHGPAGVEVLELGDDGARVLGNQPLEADERGVADEVEDGRILARHSAKSVLALPSAGSGAGE